MSTRRSILNQEFDIIAMGTHGRHRPSHVVGSSDAERAGQSELAPARHVGGVNPVGGRAVRYVCIGLRNGTRQLTQEAGASVGHCGTHRAMSLPALKK